MQRLRVSILGVWVVGSFPLLAAAQNNSSPDIAITLNEGIYYYLEGAQDKDTLETAVARFTAVLEQEPENASAMLFRALTHGRIALLLNNEKRNHQNTVRTLSEILDVRADPEGVERVRADRESARAVLSDETTSPAERRVVEARCNQYDRLLAGIEREKGRANRDLEVGRNDAASRSLTAARLERESYTFMLSDLRSLVGLLDGPQTVVHLLDVVANAKVGRIDAEEARDVARGFIAPRDASGPVEALREAEAQRLRAAAEILDSLLGEPLEERDRVRTMFFLGVIRYRLGVPLRAEVEARQLDEADVANLREAERLMAALADDETVEDGWRSYASLYLGLILPSIASAETDATVRDRELDRATERLAQAAELDAVIGDPSSIIPDLVWRQRESIDELRVSRGAAIPRNDVTLSVYAGTRYDTNVILLGERTDLPRDVSRKRDFGFTAGAAVDYTWDVAERVTLGFQVRTSQLWNVDVHEFDQQTYGGSIAVQHEAFREGDKFGPIYLALQYDFDYTLLGRSGFLESHAITPSLSFYTADRRGETDVYFTYQFRDYFEPLYDGRFDRDGDYLTIGLSHRLKLKEMTAVYEGYGWEPWGLPADKELQQNDPDYPDRYLTPYVGVSYSHDATVGKEFDRKSAALHLGVELPLPWGVQLDASSLFEWECYANGSLVDYHRRLRRDFIQEYGLTLSRTFVLRPGEQGNRYTPAFDRLLMTLRAHMTWTYDDTNTVDRLGQAIFEYDRYVCGVSVAFAFN